MAAPDSAASSEIDNGDVTTIPAAPLPMDGAPLETTVIGTDMETLTAMKPETCLIKSDPDIVVGMDSVMTEAHSPPEACEITSVYSADLHTNGGDLVLEPAAGSLLGTPDDPQLALEPQQPSHQPPMASLPPTAQQEQEQQHQQVVEEENGSHPEEPMDVAETFVTVHGERPPAATCGDASAAKRSDNVLIPDSVTWMRPAGQPLEADSSPTYDLPVPPTGAARRKASAVAPRRVPPEPGSAPAPEHRNWPRRGSSSVGRVSTDPATGAAPPPSSQPLPFDCDACQTRFGDRLSLAAHSREHGASPAEPCRRCGRLLAAPLDRARHERRHRAAAGRNSAAAESRRRAQTGASAIVSAAPTRLLPQRRGRNPTRCGACGEQFRAAALREHFAPHPRTGFYPCAVCGDAFAQHCQLELHVCSGETLQSVRSSHSTRHTAAAAPAVVAETTLVLAPVESESKQEFPAEEVDEDDAEDVGEDDGDVYLPAASSRSVRSSSDSGDMRMTARSRRHASGGGGARRSESAGADDGDADEGDDGGGDDGHSDGEGSSGGDGGRHECSHCGRHFASARNLARHARLHSKRAQLSCEVCDRVYSRLDALVRHSIEAHDQTRQFPCPRCRWKFTQQRILEYHLKGHEEGAGKPGRRGPGRRPRPYRCKACKRSFIEEAQLDAHECRADRSAEPAYVCDICGKRIKTKVWLSRHRLLHDEVRPAKCDQCGQGFIDDKALAKHAKTHTDGRRFLCDICGKGFALKVTLQIHSRTHTGERPYACEACGKRFSTRTQLFHHAKIHSGEKPYVCSVCQRGFRQSHHLKTHMKVHADRPEREAREARNSRALEPPVEELQVVRPAPVPILVQLDTSQTVAMERTLCGGVG